MSVISPDLYKIIAVYAKPGRFLGLIPAETVRRFADPQLQEQIDKLFAGLPADRQAAELEVGFDQRGVAVVGAVRLKAGWSLLGGVSWDTDRSWGGKVGVKWSGK